MTNNRRAKGQNELALLTWGNAMQQDFVNIE